MFIAGFVGFVGLSGRKCELINFVIDLSYKATLFVKLVSKERARVYGVGGEKTEARKTTESGRERKKNKSRGNMDTVREERGRGDFLLHGLRERKINVRGGGGPNITCT